MNETQQTTVRSVSNIVQLVTDIVKKCNGNGFVIPKELAGNDILLTEHVASATRKIISAQQDGLL